jgi:hypothetical protein
VKDDGWKQGAKRMLRSELHGGLYCVELWTEASGAPRVLRIRYQKLESGEGFVTTTYLPAGEGEAAIARAHQQYELWLQEGLA